MEVEDPDDSVDTLSGGADTSNNGDGGDNTDFDVYDLSGFFSDGDSGWISFG